MNHCIFDCETYPNLAMVNFRVVETREQFTVTVGDEGYVYKLREILESPYTFVGFNSQHFDKPVLAAMLAGMSSEEIKRIATMLIEQNHRSWHIYKMFGLREPSFDHIDLQDVVPGFVSLKAYGARMGMPVLQDLPYRHDKSLSDEEKSEVVKYCWNDIDTTEELFKRLAGQLKLRISMSQEYGVDMRSKSDPQMAEAVFVKRLGLRRKHNTVPDSVTFKAPHFVSFESEELNALLRRLETTDFLMDQASGHVINPDFLENDQVKIGSGAYKIGVGGIHSTHDKKVCHVAGGDYFITDIDAASYYPTVILKCGLIPQGGQAFLDEYREMYDRRLEAKRTKNKDVDAVLKIALNGTFGKLMEHNSPLYAPELGLTVTLSGQLLLLCMIEQIVKIGADVLSANTDGIAIGGTRAQLKAVSAFVEAYSKHSGFDFEYAPYRVLAIKDVNSYFAVKTDGEIKAKGIYAPPSLAKNQTTSICSRAVSEWLSKGTPIEQTILNGKLTEYISIRSVTGGGVQGDTYLGKTVRWYYTTDENYPPLTYNSNGHKVPKTAGARAAMVIDPNGELPTDLNFNWYRKEAIRIAKDVGAAAFLTEEELKLVEPPPKVRKTRTKKETK